MLCFTPVLVPFVSQQHRFLYHQDGSALSVLLALWCNALAAWLIFVVLLAVAARFHAFALLFWTGFLAYLPLVLLRDWAAMQYTSVSPVLRRIVLGLITACLGFAVLTWRPLLQQRQKLLLARVETLFGWLAIPWFVSLLQLAMLTVYAHTLDHPPLLPRHAVQQAVVSPRVIWIIMDELGYQPAFADRFPGLSLPALDAFAAQSTQFTRAQAPGLFTEFVIPEILMGHAGSRFAFTSAGGFTYTDASGHWRSLQPSDTVFGDAERAGYQTAVDGWYNPYCRLLGSVLDRCVWSSLDASLTPDFDVRASFLRNLGGPARHIWANLHVPLDFQRRSERHENELHIRDLEALTSAADSMLSDPKLTCVLIHLPVPHPTGIYNRHRQAFTTDGDSSYVDNLVLTDRVLAHLRSVLEKAGEWDSSTVLLMGDHSWRTTMQWRPLRGWTPEDELASHGLFDSRPAFLIKLPGQRTAATWDRPFATLKTRALLDAVFQRRLRTPADLQRWAASH